MEGATTTESILNPLNMKATEEVVLLIGPDHEHLRYGCYDDITVRNAITLIDQLVPAIMDCVLPERRQDSPLCQKVARKADDISSSLRHLVNFTPGLGPNGGAIPVPPEDDAPDAQDLAKLVEMGGIR